MVIPFRQIPLPVPQRRHVDAKETASHIRAALAEAFPGTTFSVKIHRYSMGSSVNVHWTGGPSRSHVDARLDCFRGVEFDGMTDSRSFVPHELNGETVIFTSWINTSRTEAPNA